MKVYVCTMEPCHDNSTIVAVTTTLDGAKALLGEHLNRGRLRWREESPGPGGSGPREWTAWVNTFGDTALITELELTQGEGS